MSHHEESHIPPPEVMFKADGSTRPGTVKSPKNRPASGSGSARKSSESWSGVAEELVPDPGYGTERSCVPSGSSPKAVQSKSSAGGAAKASP